MLNISGIEDILPRHQEISNGSKKEYTVAFDLIDTKFVSVYLGSEKQTTGYSVDIENKKVTFNSAPTTGLLVTIVRVVPASWESELHGALNSEGVNKLFTKIVASLQTIKEEVNRSLKSNVFDENNSEQKFEFFLKQLADAQDVLTRSENNLSLLEATGQDSLNNINTARDNALEDIEEIRSETISEVIELTDSFLDHDNITNCITEIPQDIKLELNDGILTLKAGSKVYAPNGKNADGSNKFDVLIVDADKQVTKSVNGKMLFIINSLSKNVAAFTPDLTYSGSEPPVGSANNILWYDTENNFIKNSVDQGVTWSNKMGLPLCAYTAENTVVTSIDQVFNGFGYVGSTIFALPGVKGLIPNGRNEDGSLKNAEFTIGRVLTYTRGSSGENYPLVIRQQDFINAVQAYYDEDSNYVRNSDGAINPRCIVGSWSADSSGKITSFNTKLPFKAVDQNDFNELDEEVAKLDEENTFTNTNTFKAIGLRVKSERYDSNTNPASTQYDAIIYLLDKYGVNLGGVNSYLDTNGNLCIFLQGRRLVNDSVVYSPRLGVTLTPDGVGRTVAFTPPSGDNSSQIATTEWCYDPTKSTNLVHRTGAETIDDVKTFNDAIIRSEAFSGASPYTIRAVDTNGKGSIATVPYYTGNTIYHRILATNTTAGVNAYLDVKVKDDGTSYLDFSGSATAKQVSFGNLTNVFVPTPAEGDNSQRAVNTAYLNSVLPTITYWD